jgi:hypothetical protein
MGGDLNCQWTFFIFNRPKNILLNWRQFFLSSVCGAFGYERALLLFYTFTPRLGKQLNFG